MRLSITNLTFPLVDEQELLGSAAALGFAGVDLVVTDDDPRLDAIRSDPAKAAKRTADGYRRAGVEVSDVLVLVGWTGDAPDAPARRQARDWFERLLDFACAIGARGMTVIAEPAPEGEHGEASLAGAAEELRWRVEKGRDAHMPVSAETAKGSVLETPHAALTLLDLVPGLTLTIDQSHFCYAGHGERDSLPLLSRARHFHCRGAAPGHLQQPLDRSTIDYEPIVAALTEQGYDGFLCCEYFPRSAFPALDDVDVWSQTIMLRDLLARSIAAS